MTPTDAMVDAAIGQLPEFSNVMRRDMRAALTAALAVSGHGEVVEALVKLRTEAWWMAKQLSARGLPGVAGDSVDQALDAARDALSRVTPTIVSQGN